MSDQIQFTPDEQEASQASSQPNTTEQVGGITFTPDEEQPPSPEIARHQTLAGNIATAALGAANTVTAGLASKGLEALGVEPSFQREMREADPEAYTVGQVGGLFTGPVGEGISAAGAGAKALVGEGIKGSAAKLAAESLLFTTTDELAKKVMQDPNQSLQTVATNVGLSALFGGMFGTAGGVLGKGVQKITDSKMGEFLSDFRNRIAEHVAPGEMPREINPEFRKFGTPQDTPLFRDVPGATPVPKEELGKPESLGAKAADSFMKSKLAGRGLGFEAGQMAGKVTGIPGMGYIGGIAGAKYLGPTIDAAIKPLMRGVINSGAFSSTIDLFSNMSKGDNHIINVSKAIFGKGMQVLPDKLLPSKEQLNDLKEALGIAQENPDKLMNTSGAISDYMPHHDAAVSQIIGSAVNHLNSIAPKPLMGSNPMDTHMPISKAQEAVYNRSLEIAQQPLKIMEHIKNGTILPSDLSTFLAIYPNLYPKVAGAMTDAMIDHVSKGGQVPYKTKIGISIFAGHPMDSTMIPQSIQATQASFQQRSQPQQQAVKPKKSTAPLSKISQSYSTPSQSRQARSSKD